MAQETNNTTAVTTVANTEVQTFFKSEENLALIKKQFFPVNADVKDIEFCLGTAAKFQLDPTLKQIHFVPRRAQVDGQWVDKVEPLVGKDGFLAIAHKICEKTVGTGARKTFSLKELRTDIVEVPKLVNGKWTMEQDLVATAFLVVKSIEKELVVETEWKHSVNYSEYVQFTKEGKPTKFWAEKADTMIKKVALSQILRMAFNVSGLYSAEEIGVGTYGDDGSLIIDVTESPRTSQLKTLSELLVAVETVGITLKFDNGMAVASGNTHANAKLLKGLGFTVVGGQWVCPCVDDRQTNKEEVETPKPAKPVKINDLADLGVALEELGLELEIKESGGKTYAGAKGVVIGCEEQLIALGFKLGKQGGWGRDVSEFVKQKREKTTLEEEAASLF